MQKNSLIKLIFSLFFLFTGLILWGQDRDTSWTLPKCIDQSMQKNISIQGKVLNNNTNLVDWEETKAKRLPSLNASVSQNFEWSRSMDLNNNYKPYAGSNGTNFGINSSLSLYNGFKTKNTIKQAELSYKAGNYDVETLKESISLNVLNAYLQILYSTELVKNSQKQVEATTEQLFLSDERLKLGSISRSDYLQVKSELASEKYTLANSQNQLAINKVALMQLMEIPVTDSFNIAYPVIDIQQDSISNIAADSIYKIALELKPQVKSSEINKEISELAISIAKAGYQPTLTLSAGINTAYGSNLDIGYYQQFQNRVVPSVGLNLSIPIYQNKVLKSNVAYAKINSENATLNEVSTKNELRKSIEQACVDYQSAIIKYQASLDKYNSAEESYKVSQEKFNQGLLNSVDFLVQKTNLIAAESELLQAKYNLVFGKKIIDFYTGVPLAL
jgi:outer membrane protein